MEEEFKLQLLFQNLGDSNRLRIIKFIWDRECSVSEIVESTGLSQPLISHHLRILRESKILDTKRSGPFVYYKLRDKRLLSALGIFLEIVNTIENNVSDLPLFSTPAWWKIHWANNEGK